MQWRAVAILAAVALAGCSRPARQTTPVPPTLVSAKATMVAAWQVPFDPTAEGALAKNPLAEQIRRGYRIFVNTTTETPKLAPGKITCVNCHLNAGQRDRALPLVGIAGLFPEYNPRAGRLITLADRIVECFVRSENAAERPTTASPEVLAVSAYITWLAEGHPMGRSPEWRNKNAIPKEHLIPVEKLDLAKGEAAYIEWCRSCHGPDGQGVAIGDKIAAPLWGDGSWNDGAGLARVYTLAGYIRYAMPYLDPGSLSDEDAQHIAAFITSKPRPVLATKSADYPVAGTLPVDAVYYRR